MRPASSLPLRIAASILGPALVGALLLPTSGGATFLVGCNSACEYQVASVQITPPVPCLAVTATVCNLGGEVAHIYNGCVSPLQLTSSFFAGAGSKGAEGGTGVNTFTVPANSDSTNAEGAPLVDGGVSYNLQANANAVGAYALALNGVLDGAPVEIVIYLAEKVGSGIDGGVGSGLDGGRGDGRADGGRRDATAEDGPTSMKSDSAIAPPDARSATDSGMDAGHVPSQDAGHDSGATTSDADASDAPASG